MAMSRYQKAGQNRNIGTANVSFEMGSSSNVWERLEHIKIAFPKQLCLSLSLAPQPSLGLGLLRNLLPLKMAEFLGGFSTIFVFTG
jgi:hypothetical protein